MKIRVISDLHIDVNEEYPLALKDKDIFTIICGDLSGYFNKSSKWIEENIKEGILVAGNHMSYNTINHSIEYFHSQYQKKYPLNAPISFMEKQYKIIDDIVFIGGTLWTDYQLFGKDRQELYMWYATKYMNDFRYAKINSSKNIENENTDYLERLRPHHCIKFFNKTIKYIDGICKQFPNKKIVVITHHAPSVQSVPKRFINEVTTPCFASNLEEFILNHPNIKLWCSGHIHQFSDYYIGDCRVVCNPRGYIRYDENTGFKEDFIIEI